MLGRGGRRESLVGPSGRTACRRQEEGQVGSMSDLHEATPPCLVEAVVGRTKARGRQPRAQGWLSQSQLQPEPRFPRLSNLDLL